MGDELNEQQQIDRRNQVRDKMLDATIILADILKEICQSRKHYPSMGLHARDSDLACLDQVMQILGNHLEHAEPDDADEVILGEGFEAYRNYCLEQESARQSSAGDRT